MVKECNSWDGVVLFLNRSEIMDFFLYLSNKILQFIFHKGIVFGSLTPDIESIVTTVTPLQNYNNFYERLMYNRQIKFYLIYETPEHIYTIRIVARRSSS